MATTTKPEWVKFLVSEPKPHSHSNTKLPVMYTAPENMRLADRDTFEPALVSIGPFHHGKFPAMDKHKTRILSSMLQRHGDVMHQTELVMGIVGAARTVEADARGYYSESFSRIDFVKMMVFDGCFILEILRTHAGLYMNDGDDPLFMARWTLPALALDIVKLENQLPYFVLEMLFERTRLPGEPPLNDLVESFLASLCPGFNALVIEDDRDQDHLLSLFHSTFIPRSNLPRLIVTDREKFHPFSTSDQDHRPRPFFIRKENNRLNSFPSVTDLFHSGIKVVKNKQWKNLLDIEYRNGKLEIPTLVIDHNTKILMRNLVAYEQCNKTIPDIFTSYATFMDALVNSAEDVEVLRVAGIINHFMNNNEEVSVLLNNLTTNIKFDMNKGYLADLNAEIYEDHHKALPQLRARFRHLVNSREGIVYVVTIFALYLTVLQTVFTVLSYVLAKQS